MQREKKRVFLHGSYAVTALLLILFLFQAPFTPSGWLIPLALLTLLWWLSAKGKPSTQLIVSGELFLLLTAAGTGLHLYDLSVAGVTYDTYMHLLAGYFTTLFLLHYLERKRMKTSNPLLAAALVLGLGLLVEVVEFFETSHTTGYWQDTVKDLVNDALGICMALLSHR